jgi:transposase
MESTKLDFAGQHVFVGLDIAKKSWKVCILLGELFHRRFSMEPDPSALVRYLKRHFPGAVYHCVYEAGYCGFWVHDELEKLGVDCIVVNPADVPTSDKERRVKTDRVDAGKLARHHRSGELRGIYIPGRSHQEDRTLVRTRAQFVRKQTRCKHQIKSLLQFYGYRCPDEVVERYWSRPYIRWLEGLKMENSSGTQALQALLKELLFLRELITRLTRQIRLLSHQESYSRRVRLLCTIPGISIITAMTLLTELVTIDRFRSLDELASYAGLVPGERSSGEEEHDTGITPRRNPAMRHMLIESAWVAARQDPALAMAFRTLSHRMPKNQAIVRIARKLLNRIRYVLKNDEPYVEAVLQSA